MLLSVASPRDIYQPANPARIRSAN